MGDCMIIILLLLVNMLLNAFGVEKMCLQDVSQIGMGLKRYKIKLDHNSKIKNLNQRFVLWGKNQ